MKNEENRYTEEQIAYALKQAEMGTAVPEHKLVLSLEDAKEKLERWRNDHNEYRPHSALTYIPPAEFTSNHGVNGP